MCYIFKYGTRRKILKQINSINNKNKPTINQSLINETNKELHIKQIIIKPFTSGNIEIMDNVFYDSRIHYLYLLEYNLILNKGILNIIRWFLNDNYLIYLLNRTCYIFVPYYNAIYKLWKMYQIGNKENYEHFFPTQFNDYFETHFKSKTDINVTYCKTKNIDGIDGLLIGWDYYNSLYLFQNRIEYVIYDIICAFNFVKSMEGLTIENCASISLLQQNSIAWNLKQYYQNQKHKLIKIHNINVTINDKINFINGNLYKNIDNKPKANIYLFNLEKLIYIFMDDIMTKKNITGTNYPLLTLHIYDNEIDCFQ